jgi:hypothetical protein
VKFAAVGETKEPPEVFTKEPFGSYLLMKEKSMNGNGENGDFDAPEGDVVGGDAFDLVDLPDIEEVQLEDQGPRLEDDATKYAVRFGIIGAGQGGGRIASTFWGLGHRRVVLVNTTEADFRGQTGSTKVVLR